MNVFRKYQYSTTGSWVFDNVSRHNDRQLCEQRNVYSRPNNSSTTMTTTTKPSTPLGA
jgi:hypothetical protein